MLAEKVCRVCLSECDELTPLWVKLPGGNRTLEETINFVVNINITLEDGLPDKICKICESILDLADTFKKRCLESESILGQQAQKKLSDGFRPKYEINDQENTEMYSEDTYCLSTSKSHTSPTNSVREITENANNIYDLPEHKIKMEIEEHHVDAGVNLSHENPKEQSLIKEEFLVERNNKEIFCCPHCSLTFETKILYKFHIHFIHGSFIHRKDGSSPKKPKLDDMQPTTAAVRSPTEDPAAADTSTNTIIETEANCDKTENSGLIKQKKNVKNLKLKEKGGKIIGKGKKDKESTKDTATMLKLSGTNTDDKITCATETQSNCFNYTVIGATGFIRTCGICGYTTATVRYLNAHLKAHAATKRYSCDSCLYLTVNLVHFNRHLRSHTDADDKPFSCDECKKKFSLRTNLVAHLKTHTGDKPYSCDMCEKNFAQKSYLVKHRRKHSDERPYSCDVCDRKFSCKDYVVAHVNTHSGLTPYSCVVCGKKFNSKNYLNQHVRTHTGKRPYSCDICDMKFIRKKSFEGHISNHTGIMPYSCDVCKMKFIRKSYLIKHVRIHTGEKPYSCDVCQKKFVQKHYLVAHRRTHTGVRPYSCDVCDKKFFQKKYLNIHLKTHTGEKPYSCDICGMKFLRKSNLVAHVSTHTGNKPYSCDVCEMKFIHKYHLNRHIARIHTGEKPFSCNVCKKKFSQRANLDRHLKTHTGEKPYSCDVCQKKFVLKDYLDVHRRTHTGVRPYSCNVCDMKFFEKKSLNRHLKTHTGEKPYSCDMCERKFIEKYNLLNHVRKIHR